MLDCSILQLIPREAWKYARCQETGELPGALLASTGCCRSSYADQYGAELGGLIDGMAAVYLLLQMGEFGEMYTRHKLGQRFIFDLQVRIYAYLQRLSLSFFERTSTGELMSRVTNDVNSLEQFVTHGMTLTIVDLLRLLGACGVLLALDSRLALVAMIPLPIIAVALRRFNRIARPVYRSARDRLGEINARLQDNLAGMPVIQAFGQEQSELSKFLQTSQRYYRERVRAIWTWSTFFPVLHFVAAMGTVMVLGVGARLVVNDQLSLGTLVAFLSYVISFYDPLRRLTEIDNTVQQAIAAGERIFELLDEQPDVQDAPGAVVLEDCQGDILFDHVYFQYEDGVEVLHDITFHMRPGEVVALVGPSGAGKSSIANLICRFYISVQYQRLRELALWQSRCWPTGSCRCSEGC